MKYIKTTLILITIFISGCYTKFITRPLENPKEVWQSKHKWQYYPQTEWGKEWNLYYWHPRWTDKKIYPSPKKTAGEQKKDFDKRRRKIRSRKRESNCCCVSPFFDAIVHIIFPNIHEYNDDYEYPDTTARPARRRGT